MTGPGYQDSTLFHPPAATVDTTIAAIHASRQTEGHISITGTITTLDRRHSGRGHAWVELILADHSHETIPVLVFPKTYDTCHQHLAEHADIRVTGRLNQTRDRVEIYASSIEPNSDLPDWEH